MCPEREIIVSGILLHTPCKWVFACSVEPLVTPLFHMHVECVQSGTASPVIVQVQTVYGINNAHLCLAVWLCSCDAPEQTLT